MNKSGKLRGTLYAYNWLKDIKYSPAYDSDIVQVIFKNTRTGFFHNPDGLPLKNNEWVAVEASPGHDIGQVMLTGPLVALQMKKAGVAPDAELKRIFRKASDADMEKFREAREREHPTMIRSRQIAAELGLNMKIGDVEYQGDGAKAIFYYIADERVDFRKLIRILADTFKIRIEMKQIGARQEAGRIGGIGPCGRPLCCSSWMSKFNSVGTGAARIQDLSMNPQKLAGQCAKLKCCLNFETDVYAEAAKDFPNKDVSLFTLDQEYFHFKSDILARKISYSTDKKLAVNVVTISVERANEIILMNKNGEKPESLEEAKVEEPARKEYVELVGQDSLTRFDKKNKKGKKDKSGADSDAKERSSDRRSGRNRRKNSSADKERMNKQNPADKDTKKQSSSQGNQRDKNKTRNKATTPNKDNSNQQTAPKNNQQSKDTKSKENKPKNKAQANRRPKGRNNVQSHDSTSQIADTSQPVKKDYSAASSAMLPSERTSAPRRQQRRNRPPRKNHQD